MTDLDRIMLARDMARRFILGARRDDGLWRGELSSSAVSTAVACCALTKVSDDEHTKIGLARQWLVRNINDDGGWGDTPESGSNLSATLLSHAALFTAHDKGREIKKALERSGRWINTGLGGTEIEYVAAGIRKVYGKDLSFSAPILTLCVLSGMFGNETENWRYVPRLPFELSVLPGGIYNFLGLPVVSYALPALISVGIARTRHYGSKVPFAEDLTKLCERTAILKLLRSMPEHGGFLEAPPLTAFVALCLGCSGYKEHMIVRRGLEFLKSTMRPDGSWPIDTDLAHWVTIQAVKALGKDNISPPEDKTRLAEKLAKKQYRTVHPYTSAKPGGWGWTDLPGAVPDADDTAGMLMAIWELSPGSVTETVCMGLEWLISLMNKDGGIPTFCRGWGFLPFDRSCPDISAHALGAFCVWRDHVPSGLSNKIEKAVERIIAYLERARDKDNVWSPLWFGDQNSRKKTARVYGTAVVLTGLAHLPLERVSYLVLPAVDWLKKAGNADGGWGGEPGTPSNFEMTAKAVAALSLYVDVESDELRSGIDHIIKALIANNGSFEPSPIGLYFSSLWYGEKLYPASWGLNALNNVLKKYDRETNAV